METFLEFISLSSVAIPKDKQNFSCMDMPMIKGNIFQGDCIYISSKVFFFSFRFEQSVSF